MPEKHQGARGICIMTTWTTRVGFIPWVRHTRQAPCEREGALSSKQKGRWEWTRKCQPSSGLAGRLRQGCWEPSSAPLPGPFPFPACT